ncbi:carboxypeptidase-like regulatory domain-containing protein [Myxococcus landrumensis]|uniref:Carboxypeptidase regulatory-like domain-containing protein n=1 Tax=Myxococcus landrumensis TaxID=2813577 RepID=A0ABX7MZG9_9BACT|nr:carboxypeptidase-like regulatory domain-containing protein [Myxococcus landrumus]QSQ11831.1 carboxypeptidase regulatory-like domain-containing protein [Myxococcus landrumus]
MRVWIVGTVIAGALVLLLWQVLGAPSSPPMGGTASAPRLASSGAVPRTSAPTRAHANGLSIRGTVVDAWGKGVAGAHVSASSPEAGQTLSEIPCPDEALPPWEVVTGETPLRRKLAWCLPQSQDIVLAMLLAREGEATVSAEAVSDKDGMFVLEGLPEGPQALLALSARGTAMRRGVPAGSQGVALTLESPRYLKGRALGDEEPLSGASVMVVGREYTRFFDGATTDDGRFQVGPLPPGSYLVLISKEGWIPALEELPLGVEDAEVKLRRRHRLSGQVVANGVPVPSVEVLAASASALTGAPPLRTTSDEQGRFSFELGTGHHTLTAEQDGRYALAQVKLPVSPPSNVLLKLGEALHAEGTVFNDAGGTVAGAKVSLERPGHGGKELSVVTDANGRYRVGPLQPARWTFVLQAEGHLDMLEGEVLEVKPGMRPLDFMMKRAASITGRVLDPAGRPVPGLHLELERDTPEEPVEYELQEGTFSGRDGRFVLDASEPGEYRVLIREDHFLPARIAVKAPSTGVDITLSEGASVEGTLTDARGLPLPGFYMSVIPLAEEGSDPANRMEATTTDAQGRFHRKGLTPGRYRVLAERETDSVDQAVWTDVEVTKDTVVKVALRRPEEHALEGVVVDVEGKPVERVGVRATSVEAPGRLETSCFRKDIVGVLTDAHGRFILQGLTQGRHTLNAMRVGHTFLPERSSGGTAGANGLEVSEETRQVRLVVKRHSHVRGRLIGPDGAPLRDIVINENPVKTREDGSFSIPNHGQPTTAPFFFTAKKLPTVTRMVQGGWESPDVDLGDIQMETGRYIIGQVLSASSGQPVGGLHVLVNVEGVIPDEERMAPLASTAVNSEGRFILGPLEPRPLTLEFRDRQTRFRTLHLKVDETEREVTARLTPRIRVTATAKDLKGRPVEGRVISVSAGTQKSFPMTDGVALVDGLDTGTHELLLHPHPRSQERGEFAPVRLVVPAEGGDMAVVFQPVEPTAR